MTTTAIDSKRKLVTCDSRWSFVDGDDVFYVDDTGFDKIVSRAFGTLVCAGDARLIEQWRNWFMTPTVNMQGMPPTERVDNMGKTQGIAVSLVLSPEGKPLFSNGTHVLYEDFARFSGSGSYHAYQCFAVNGCGLRCIESAAKMDPMTGGETKYFDFTKKDTNAGWTPITVEEVEKLFLTRGMVMNTKTKAVTPIQQHPKFAGGAGAHDFSLSAPTGQPTRAWSEVEKVRFLEAMQVILDREADGVK